MDVVDLEGYDMANEVKEFDESKGGVKGLLDSGIVKLPRFMIHPPETRPSATPSNITSSLQIPIIDFTGYDESFGRSKIVREIREASETWGFFQIINHSVPVSVMDGMLRAIREFHDQPTEVKKPWYSRDSNAKIKYFSNSDLFVAKAANWRDTIAFDMLDGRPINPEAYPPVCRDGVMEYQEHMLKMKDIMSELLSEALGLEKEYLRKIECMEAEIMVGNYYPVCPEPELTYGATRHSDPSCLTIVLQDTLGGLQVFHENQLVDIKPLPGALVVNIGDFLQIISNDRFKSVLHQVLAARDGNRVSVACFMYPHPDRKYGPIKEFLTKDNPPKYRDTNTREYLTQYRSKSLDGSKTLPYFRV
ncbi:hypothetical protein VNO78_21978 [Psophocarpus tetragonolobus]|uniref:Fe2OG dioxygenase domain-containing protein n=1 Tax=Psophocarpus tetragonolobus TaxID=3891 RepID=A0AAN9SCI3_PSOTE